LRYRSWSQVTSGVLLNVIGAVQYGTARVLYKIVPYFDAQDFRQYLHQVMAIFSKTGKEVVMVIDRSGIHRAKKTRPDSGALAGAVAVPFVAARCGHHLNPIEGFWQRMQEVIGAGRCFSDLQQLYWRTRQVLRVHPRKADL
jgi:transposase